MTAAYVGGAPLNVGARKVEGQQVEIGGERFYRIVNCDAMPPFLMSIVSDSDQWMFVSSTGALTAGRRDPDHALFPYYTDDRIHDSQDQTGGKTIFLVARDGRIELWEPFSQRYEGLYRITRSLSKSIYGNRVIFEEVNHDLALSFSCTWMSSNRYGFVRRTALLNLSAEPVEIDLLDGIQNLLPHGLTRRFQLEYSTLADGYKENELDPETGLGLFKLSSIPADRPEPNEALRVTTVWSEGLQPARRLLCSAQVDRFRRGETVDEETLIRGRRGAYFVNTRLTIPSRGFREWSIVAEIDQDAANVAALRALLKSGANLRAQLDEDVERGTVNLVRIVAGADGLVLFNRFFQPEIDVESLEMAPRLELSTSEDLRLRIRWLGLLRDQVKLSLACSGGVHTPADIVKSLLAGADAVQVVAALLIRGPGRLGELLKGLVEWMEAHEYESVEQMIGALSLRNCPDSEAYERGNYLKTLQLWRE